MRNIYKPFVGTDEIRFETNRSDLNRILGNEFIIFKRNRFSINTLDFYKSRGIFINYDENNLCNAIEFANNSNLFYDNVNLFDLSFMQLRNKFDNLSDQVDIEDDLGITYYDLGFGVTKSEDFSIESILIFSKDYW